MKHPFFAGALITVLTTSLCWAQTKQGRDSVPPGVVLGRLENGATVSFVSSAPSEWGIDISGNGSPHFNQLKPAEIEVFGSDGNTVDLAAAYDSVRQGNAEIIAPAKVTSQSHAVLTVEDRWKIEGGVLSLSRHVIVTSGEDRAAFYSAIRLKTAPAIVWSDLDYMAPGALYGDASGNGESAPGGTLNYRAKRLEFREDQLAAPLFAMSFHDGYWAAVLDVAPRGDTTWAETTAPINTIIVDERLQFGAVGAHQDPSGGIEFGFWYPGTTSGVTAVSGAPPKPGVRRRYHPLKTGFVQDYSVGFRFGRSADFSAVERGAWRWAWQTLNPAVMPLDLNLVRRTLTDHLEAHVIEVNGRAGVPFLYDVVTGKPGSIRTPIYATGGASVPPRPYPEEQSPEQKAELQAWAQSVGVDLDSSFSELWRWPKVVMGFVSKGTEVADQLLIEADRDSSPRGQKMRQSGLAIMDSYVRLLPMSPPSASGFSLETGKPDSEPPGIFFLRAPSEGMQTVMEAYVREKRAGHDHTEWLAWCRQFADWLLTQQRPDGSFPRSWKNGTGEVNEESGTSSYNPVPLLVSLSRVTGEKKYLEASILAGDYVWQNFGSRGVFVGGTTDNPNVVDKEAGMLSLEAFLALYDATHEPKWLDHAKAAGDYTESWIWIWNLPMPVDADDTKLAWKRGVSTVGVQGISARGPGGVDEYLDWAVPQFAELYKDTKDEHYLDVARVLLFETKSMLALPGRTYDMAGPGWQQENWGMGPGRRGFGSHRSWLPWVSANHLHGITGLEQLDPALFHELSK
jgi:hypothetical protein